MKVGDLVYMTDKCFESFSRPSNNIQRTGIILKKHRAYQIPDVFNDGDDEGVSLDGYEYDCVFGGRVISGLLWGWEITEVR